MASLVRCYNKGCTKMFDPDDNPQDACRYHPGGPIFHDALKGWSCCKKRSTDFTEFLNIPGCATGPHSNEKPAEPKPPEPDSSLDGEEIFQEAMPQVIKPAVPEDRPSQHEPMIKLKATVGATLKQALDKLLKEMTLQSNSSCDRSSDGEIKKGSNCKNNTCTKKYEDESSNDDPCQFHPGSPVFHEGMKYWSCCQRKTTEFDNFLAQEGCEVGLHVWAKEVEEEKQVKCRYDWHQTGNFISISVFAKVAMPEKTVIEVNKVAVKMSVVFEGGKSYFSEHILLNGVIDPERSNVKLLGTKVEINLRKMEPGSWPCLELAPSQLNADSDTTQMH